MMNSDSQTHTANTILELAAATAANRATMVALTTSVQTLTAQLAATQAQFVTALAQLAATNARNTTGGNACERDSDPNPYGKGRNYC